MSKSIKKPLLLYIYDFFWQIFIPLIFLYILLRVLFNKEEKNRLKERFSVSWNYKRPNGEIVWLHAVSLGETVAAVNLAGELNLLMPNISILVSTNTITSAKYVSNKNQIIHCYQPLDHPFFVKKFLDYWKPDCAIFMESDYWPNLIFKSYIRKIPIFFASAQLSKKSFSKWIKTPSLSRNIFNCPKLIFCVDDKQKSYFSKLRRNNLDKNIIIGGSLKISKSKLITEKSLISKLKKWRGKSKIVLAASIHENEEHIILSAHRKLIRKGYKHKLLIAPRHPKFGATLSKNLNNVKRKSLNQFPSLKDNIFICDTIGEMGSLYSVSDIIVLCGSFKPLGGHNPLEPVQFGKIILTGKSQEKNFSDFTNLKEIGIVKEVNNKDDLANSIINYLLKKIDKKTSLMGIKYASEAFNRNQIIALKITKLLKSNEYKIT